MKNNEYATKDLHFAGFLKIQKVKLVKIERLDESFPTSSWNKIEHRKNPLYFIFTDSEKCKELEKAFWDGEGDSVMVNIKDYIMSVRELRSRIFAIKK